MNCRENSNIWVPICVVVLVLTAAGPVFGRTIHVDPNGQADFTSIQAAIDDANNGDEIEVAPGIYNEAISFGGKAVRLYSSGGIAATTINANKLNSSVVTCNSDEGANTVLEGFTITAGTGTFVDGFRCGGGMYNYNSSPTVKNCDFTANCFAGDGGGMYNYNSNPTVTDCNFTGNTPTCCKGLRYAYYIGSWDKLPDFDSMTAADTGPLANFDISPRSRNDNFGFRFNGYIYIQNEGNYTFYLRSDDGSKLYIDGTQVVDNDGLHNSGSEKSSTVWLARGEHAIKVVYFEKTGVELLEVSWSSPWLAKRLFSEQDFYPSSTRGAGMYNEGGTPTVTSCSFTDNSAAFGAGMNNNGSSPAVSDCNFAENNAAEGGGIYNRNAANPAVANCTFTANSSSNMGGGIYNLDSEPNITGCTFTGNSSNDGGGVYNHFGISPRIADCNFSENSASAAGAAIYNNSSGPAITNCNFSQNTVSGTAWGGAGIFNTGASPNVSDCNFSGNEAPYGGGMFNLWGSDSTVTDCNFIGNSVTGAGGAIYSRKSTNNLTGCTFTGNSSNDGGAIFSYDYNNSEIIDCNFTGNTAGDKGGALYFTTYDNSVISGCSFSGNSARHGGAIGAFKQCSLDVSDCNFAGNAATGDSAEGGAMWNAYGCSPTVTDCSFTDNTSGHNGGAVCNTNWIGDTGRPTDRSNAVLVNCLLTGNQAQYGGAIFSLLSDPSVTNCILSTNTANVQGGAVYNHFSFPELANCLFVDNSAGSGIGGAIFNGYSSPTVTNCTFTGNSAPDGGAMYSRGWASSYPSRPFVTNCIFWGDTPNEIVDVAADGALTTVIYSNVQGGWPGAFNIDVSPSFVDANAGDLRLDIGSPCTDAGANTYAGGTDIDGYPRITDGDGNGSAVVDMGAYEADCLLVNVAAGIGTIQQAIDAARLGAEIIVGPGTYNEAINLRGKALTLRSSDGAQATIIDAAGLDSPVVICASGEDARTMLKGFTIRGGSSTEGGGIFCQGSSPTISDCSITGNSGSNDGGGLYCDQANPTVVNCLIYGNTAGSGAGIYCTDSSPTITNCTISLNSATSGGGIYCDASSAPKVANCILWADTPTEIQNQGGTPTVSYCDVQGGYAGAGNNIDADPLFSDASTGDFDLGRDSPCFNAGSNAAEAIAQTDFEGGARIVFGTVDIGALELDISSRLELVITPQDAADEGGKWRLVGESQWRDSGDVVYDLTAGYYQAEFKEAPGWTEPEELAVCVLADTFTSPVAEYRRVPAFDIGQIPPRDAPHGRKLAFSVYSEQLGSSAALSAFADPLPQGPVYFDPDGLFTYEPNDTDDRTPFFVAFTAEIAGSDPCSQVVEITPIPHLPPESAIVSRPVQDFPDANCRDYVFEVNDLWLQDPCDPATHIYFNAAKRATRSVKIAGIRLVLENGRVVFPDGSYFGPYGYNDQVVNIYDMSIYAETLIIRSSLHLPQTDVTIYARELIFENDGSINTTPLDDWTTPQFNTARCPWAGNYNRNLDPVDGQDGHPGGNVTLYIESFEAGAGAGPWFIMDGAAAQAPEPGSNGAQQSPVPLVGTGYAGYPGSVTYIDFYNYWRNWLRQCKTTHYMLGSKTLPKPDYDAVCAGKPGNGGAGGNLTSTLDLSAYVRSNGGSSAAPAQGNDYTGGTGGGPNPAYHAVMHHHGCSGEDLYHWHDDDCVLYDVPASQKGKVWLVYKARSSESAPAPAPDLEIGPDGQTRCRPDALSWLSPCALKMKLAHAKDAYLYGYAAETRGILTEYQDLLNTYLALPQFNDLPGQWKLELQQMHHEIVTILHRIANGFDYFGNPPNWTPMLSYEALRTAYEQEIDHAIRVLYLSYWLQNKADDLTQTRNALRKTRENLWAQTQSYRDDYELTARIIGPLKTEAENIAAKMGRADPGGCYGLLCDLQRKEADLLKTAKADVEGPWWKKALKSLGTIAFSTATGASRGGKTGAGLGAVAGIIDVALNQDDSWSDLSMRADVVKQFNGTQFDEATIGWLGQFDKIGDVNDIEGYGADGYLDDMKSTASAMANGLYDVKEALMTTSIGDERVEAELKKIKAKDPQFNQLVDRVMELMVQKEVFNRRLAAALQEISTLSAEITNNVLAIDAMNGRADSISQILDPRAIMYVKDMERRALARLLKYHYYMAKAYEYRLLEPYPADFNVQRIFDDMKNIASLDGTLTGTDFGVLRGFYEDQLQEVTDAILDRYTWGEEIEHSKLGETSLWPEEIEKLNADKAITINLVERGMFVAQRENLRILNVNVLSIELEEDPEGTCPSAYVTLYVEHSGLSKVQYAGETYEFTHPGENIYWDTDCYVNGRIDPPQTSDAQDSLLSMLLGGLDPDNIMFYSRPAAWADILIDRDLTQVYPCTDVQIKSLRLGVRYDYRLREDYLKALDVAIEPNGPDWGLMPYFVIDTLDENNRQDGIGSFRRMYDCWDAASVGITAPETHGCWRFNRWTNNVGQTIGSRPGLAVTLDCDGPDQWSIHAVYDYEGPPLSPADFDQSAYVDFGDFDALTSKWQTISTDPQWDSRYDISETADGVIDMRDVAAFAEGWLTTPQ